MGFFPIVFVLGAVWSRERRLGKWARAIILLQAFAILFFRVVQIKNWYEIMWNRWTLSNIIINRSFKDRFCFFLPEVNTDFFVLV